MSDRFNGVKQHLGTDLSVDTALQMHYGYIFLHFSSRIAQVVEGDLTPHNPNRWDGYEPQPRTSLI